MPLYQMTGNDVVNEALLLIKRITVGQIAAPVEVTTGQWTLNNLIGQFNALGLLVYSAAPVRFTVSSGTADYPLGPGSVYSTTRPVKIEAWNFQTTSGQANGGAPLDAVEFSHVAEDRKASGSRVKALNYDAAFASGVGSVHLYPIPNNAGTLELWCWEQFAQISDFTAVLTYPWGYLQALVANLAFLLAPKFDHPLDPALKLAADASIAALASANASQHHTPQPPAAPNAA